MLTLFSISYVFLLGQRIAFFFLFTICRTRYDDEKDNHANLQKFKRCFCNLVSIQMHHSHSLSINQSIYLSLYLSIYVNLFIIIFQYSHQFIYRSFLKSIYLSQSFKIYLSQSFKIYLSIYPSCFISFLFHSILIFITIQNTHLIYIYIYIYIWLAGYWWKSKDEHISDVLLCISELEYGRLHRPTKNIHQVCADTGRSQEDQPGVIDGKNGWWERGTPSSQCDLYIYIYI